METSMIEQAVRLQAVVRQRDEGERIVHGAEEMRFCLAPEETGGRIALIERVVSPNFQSPPLAHAQTREDCVGFLLAGRLVFQLDGEVREIGEGGTLFLPRGVFFRWWNPDPTAARALFIYAPGKFGNFFKEIIRATTQAAERLHDYDKTLSAILAIQDSYGMVRQEGASSQ
jgi:hypothetical protein